MNYISKSIVAVLSLLFLVLQISSCATRIHMPLNGKTKGGGTIIGNPKPYLPSPPLPAVSPRQPYPIDPDTPSHPANALSEYPVDINTDPVLVWSEEGIAIILPHPVIKLPTTEYDGHY